MVGPVQEDAAGAGQADLAFVTGGLEHAGASAEFPAADRARGWTGGDRGCKRQVWSGEVVPLRPLVDQRGAFGRALSAQRRIDVAALHPRRRLGGAHARGAWLQRVARQLQAEPTPALQLQVRRAQVVQPANPQRWQPTRINQVSHRARRQVEYAAAMPYRRESGQNCCYLRHTQLSHIWRRQPLTSGS